ncbi:hypothetical protein Taro_020452 [Colocasia esculenta]|uniref:Uncharacterized protein n=1 Tax=Colocasia esculenta TaxID=4460 RepID=A0A843V2D2_COLES|nr:hypothetical protein [Colocasia esculenta]
MPHTLKGRRKSSKLGNQACQSRNPPFLVIIGLLNTMGRVEELLVAEELWNDHKKPFFFPFSSAATCTNHPLEVDQRIYKYIYHGLCIAEFGGPAPIPECLFSWEPQVLCEPDTCVCSGLVPVQWYCRGLVVFLDTLTLEESCRPAEGKTTVGQ